MNRREMLLATLAAGLVGKVAPPDVGTRVLDLKHIRDRMVPLMCTADGPGGRWVFFASIGGTTDAEATVTGDA